MCEGNETNMAIQMILCVETNKRADTDSIYIQEIINHLYIINNQIKISKVYMGTKSKYKAKDVSREIGNKTKAFTIGETKVIYCIDTDEYEKNIEHERELNDISRFCEENGYDLIWFCHDVEDVFIGNKIPDSQKVQTAGEFRRKGKMKEMDLDKLSSNEKRAHASNILKVLDKYLSRK